MPQRIKILMQYTVYLHTHTHKKKKKKKNLLQTEGRKEGKNSFREIANKNGKFYLFFSSLSMNTVVKGDIFCCLTVKGNRKSDW